MADSLKMIDLINISKTFFIGDTEVHALENVSLSIGNGEFVGIVGPSGSGKSTLMNILGVLDTASSGVYLLDGTPIDSYSNQELSRIRNRHIGFVFQSFNLIGRMTIEENVELPLIYQGIKTKQRKLLVDEALERVGIMERRRHTPKSVSGGQQQRAAIARALVTQPTLILADEPTGNLDSRTGQEIMLLLHELNSSGRTIVLITHDSQIASQTGRTVRILDGRVSAS
jgi:putative ABC transport system ATP-binding protein